MVSSNLVTYSVADMEGVKGFTPRLSLNIMGNNL